MNRASRNFLFLIALLSFANSKTFAQDCDILNIATNRFGNDRLYVSLNSNKYWIGFKTNQSLKENLLLTFSGRDLDSIIAIATQLKPKKSFWKKCNTSNIKFATNSKEKKLFTYNGKRDKYSVLKHQLSLFRIIYINEPIYYKDYAIVEWWTKQHPKSGEYHFIQLLKKKNGIWILEKELFGEVS